jgi:hypothetical protein
VTLSSKHILNGLLNASNLDWQVIQLASTKGAALE